MSDGASWFYSLPTYDVTGYEVYQSNGAFKISKRVTRTVRGLIPYASSGEGFYPTKEAAQQGILRYYLDAINMMTNKITSFKKSVKEHKRQFKEFNKVLKKQNAKRIIVGTIKLYRDRAASDCVSVIIATDGQVYEAADLWVSSIHDGKHVQAFLDENNRIVSAKILGGKDGKDD